MPVVKRQRCVLVLMVLAQLGSANKISVCAVVCHALGRPVQPQISKDCQGISAEMEDLTRCLFFFWGGDQLKTQQRKKRISMQREVPQSEVSRVRGERHSAGLCWR